MSVIVRALSSDSPCQSLVPSNPDTTKSHTVVFYDDDSLLLQALTQSVSASIKAGNSAIVIATPDHHQGLFNHLRSHSDDAYAAIMDGRLFLLDAAETLSNFMVDGEPDPDLFARVMGNYLTLLAAASRREDRHVFAFGEMVAVLWQQGQCAAALRVEQLWNQLVASHSFDLCCAYPLHLFPDPCAAANPILRDEYALHPGLFAVRG